MLARIAAYVSGACFAGGICSVLNRTYVPTNDGLSSAWGVPWISFSVVALFDLAVTWLILRLYDLGKFPRSMITYLIAGALGGLTFVVLLGVFENDALLWELPEMVSGAIDGIVAALCWFAMKRTLRIKV